MTHINSRQFVDSKPLDISEKPDKETAEGDGIFAGIFSVADQPEETEMSRKTSNADHTHDEHGDKNENSEGDKRNKNNNSNPNPQNLLLETTPDGEITTNNETDQVSKTGEHKTGVLTGEADLKSVTSRNNLNYLVKKEIGNKDGVNMAKSLINSKEVSITADQINSKKSSQIVNPGKKKNKTPIQSRAILNLTNNEESKNNTSRKSPKGVEILGPKEIHNASHKSTVHTKLIGAAIIPNRSADNFSDGNTTKNITVNKNFLSENILKKGSQKKGFNVNVLESVKQKQGSITKIKHVQVNQNDFDLIKNKTSNSYLSFEKKPMQFIKNNLSVSESIDQKTMTTSDINSNQNSNSNSNHQSSNNNLNNSGTTPRLNEHNLQQLDLRDKNVAQGLLRRIEKAMEKGSTGLELSLRPKNLGKLRIGISVENNVTNIRILTETQSAALLLGESQNKLSQMMESAGLRLSDFSSFTAQDHSNKESQEGNEGHRNSPEEDKPIHQNRHETENQNLLNNSDKTLLNVVA